MDPEELDAWEPQEPPADFAERVVAEATGSGKPARSRRWVYGAVGGLLAAGVAAGAVVYAMPRGADHGAAIAAERREVRLGDRGVAVLEAGGRIEWRGSVVTQEAGNVFYRVEPGSSFRVETPSGRVDVLGTCFRVKVKGGKPKEDEVKKRDMVSASVGAVAGALAFVGVYEGKVAVSQAGERVELAAGESAIAGPDGVKPAGDLADGERAFDATDAPSNAYAAANDRLAGQIRELNRQLTKLDDEKETLERNLATAKQQLASIESDGSVAVPKNEFDLDQNDWAELAKNGTIKYRVPCVRKEGWKPSPEALDKLGLAPDDAETIAEAYASSNARVWGEIKPLCTEILSGSSELADLLGPDTCTHVVLTQERNRSGSSASEAMRQVGEMRAGLRPMPAPGEAVNPVAKVFLALTGELSKFQSELAESFGPEEAHRLAFSEDLCVSRSTFGGPGPRKPKE